MTTSFQLVELANSTIISSVLDTLNINYSVIDSNGNYILQNKSMETSISKGLTQAEEIDRTSWEDCKRVMANKRREIKEEVFEGKYYLSIKQPLIENDVCIGILVVSFDITDRKKAEIAKQEFLQNMAHDIRTPLAGIIGVSELFERGLIKTEETSAYGKMMFNAGNQLLELPNVVIHSIDTEHMTDPVKVEPLHLLGLAEELLALFQPSLHTKPLVFNLNIDPKLPIVLTDRIKLKRILINIISNAFKFTKEGKITFTIKCLSIENNHINIEMSVSDTGIGIAPDKLDQIFDRFYRIHPTYVPEYSGYGIGLYAVKKTLELLNGQIKASSESGKGSCFTLSFNFPLAQPPQITKIETIPEESLVLPENQTNNGTILIAEDNPLVCLVIKRMLTELNYTVVATKDGDAALEALKKQSFDWALLDIGLPGLRGTEVCKSYRDWEKELNKVHLPIFALTGHSVGEVAKECSEAGIDRVFTKPLTKKMIEEIESALTEIA